MLCFKGTLGNFETVIDMRVAYHFHRAKTNCCSNRLTYYGYVLSDLLASCRIPDDCIDSNRYPLFMARAVLKELIESLQSTQAVKPC